MEVTGKVAIITGASMGIGMATARRFAQAEARLALVARSVDRLIALTDELRQAGHEAVALPCDMRDPAAVKAMVEQAFQHFGRIDILVNNAGQAAAGTVADVDPRHFQQIVELNLFGPLYAMQAVIPLMRQGGGGMILNVSSMVSKMHIPGLSTYAATKAALNILSDTARVELAEENIRVITVYPRMTSTDFGRNSLGSRPMRERQRAGSHAPVGAAAPVVDSAEHVAEKILQAVQNEPAEQFMDV